MAPYALHHTQPNRRRLSLQRILSEHPAAGSRGVTLPLELGYGYGTISEKSARSLAASTHTLRSARSPARPALSPELPPAALPPSPSRLQQRPLARVDAPSLLAETAPAALERVAALLPPDAAGRLRGAPLAFRAREGELPDAGHLPFDAAVFDACMRGLHRFVLLLDLFSVAEPLGQGLRARFHRANLLVGAYFDRFRPEACFLFAVEKESPGASPPRVAVMRPAPAAYPSSLFRSLPSLPGSPILATPPGVTPRRLSLDSAAGGAFRLSGSRAACPFSPDLVPVLHGTYATLSARAGSFGSPPAWAPLDGAVVASVEVAFFP